MVVDFGDRPDGRARVPAGALLIDRDGRREPVDLVDVGLLHLPEELAGIGAQALDVPALALRIDRIEGEAGLAGTTQSGDDDEAIAGEGDRDVLEVVFARSAHDELILGHMTSLPDGPHFEQAFVRIDSAGSSRRPPRQCRITRAFEIPPTSPAVIASAI